MVIDTRDERMGGLNEAWSPLPKNAIIVRNTTTHGSASAPKYTSVSVTNERNVPRVRLTEFPTWISGSSLEDKIEGQSKKVKQETEEAEKTQTEVARWTTTYLRYEWYIAAMHRKQTERWGLYRSY